jgi:ABC-type sugar transport system ATPase subunit
MTIAADAGDRVNRAESEDMLLGLRSVSKSYGHVQALIDIDFDLAAGEIVALVGDNGAGKSTIVKILSGVITPDKGTILVRGQETVFHNPQDAYSGGTFTVFQDLALVEALDVGRNVFLGREPSRFGLVRRRQMDREALGVFTTFGIKVPSMSRSAEQPPSSWTSRPRPLAFARPPMCSTSCASFAIRAAASSS